MLEAATCTTGAITETVIFDDHGTGLLSGEYPTGKITWPSGPWMVSGPWQSFTTNSLSFTNSQTTSGTFTLMKGQILSSVRSYNGGTVSSTVTVACSPNPTKTYVLPAGSITTLALGWTLACSTVTLTSSNAWNTNFDDITMQTPNPYTPTPTIKWDQLDHSNTDGFRVYWRHPGDSTWLGHLDLPIDTDSLFYPGIDLDFPIQRLIPASEQNVEVEIMVKAYNNKTPPEESNASATLIICMPPLQPCNGCLSQ